MSISAPKEMRASMALRFPTLAAMCSEDHPLLFFACRLAARWHSTSIASDPAVCVRAPLEYAHMHTTWACAHAHMHTCAHAHIHTYTHAHIHDTQATRTHIHACKQHIQHTHNTQHTRALRRVPRVGASERTGGAASEDGRCSV
eukprot:3152023-Rhodomonas_salina.1